MRIKLCVRKILVFVFIYLFYPLYGQIGIGTKTPNASSALDVFSSEKGILFPQMNNEGRDNIINPAEGLIIYNITESCLQINKGSSISPNWSCVGSTPTSSLSSFSVNVSSNCSDNGFQGIYISGIPMVDTNKFTLQITNNTFTTANMNFDINDLVLSGISGISINDVTPTSATIASGETQTVEYTLTGIPNQTGVLNGVWTKLGLTCSNSVNVILGKANFTLPQSIFVTSIYDGNPLINIQGLIDNDTHKLIVNIPYTEGTGAYTAYAGEYIPNNIGTGEGGDINSFRLTYPAGTFSPSGSIVATIEVDGDGVFNAKKELFGVQKNIQSLNFNINNINIGSVNLNIIAGIPDRNFADNSHKFIYIPIIAADGNTWLNNNLGANYSNMNHPQFNPNKQATALNDYNAYGSLFQWGRYSDGHELINWTDSTTGTPVNGSTSVNAVSDTPINNLFIIETGPQADWRIPKNDNLWKGSSGINNPCPQGFRLPTWDEINTLYTSENITNNTSGFNSSLAFSASGTRRSSNGLLVGDSGSGITNWTGSIDKGNNFARAYSMLSVHVGISNIGRANGYGVRCIKD